MLKVEYSKNYSKKERTDSETLKEIQYVKQLNSQIRSKRSDDIIKLPENFEVGQAIANGNCFFDSLRQGLEQRLGIQVTVEQLRQYCKEFAQNNPPEWFVNAIANSCDNSGRLRSETPDSYIGNILNSNRWGDPEVEGRILCEKYSVKLHIAESNPLHATDTQQDQFLHQLIDNSGSKNAGEHNKIDYGDSNIIHIINRGNAHFEPILSTQEIQYRRSDVDVEPRSGPSSPKRPKLSISNNSHQSSDIQEDRKPTGLCTSYHGIAYQVQWMMVVALEAQERLKNKKSGAFNFKTEDPDAGKFDDLVWRYETDQPNPYEYNFLQAKHKLNKEEKITLKELLKPKQKKDSLKSNEKDKRPFALEKYFLSYRDEISKSDKYKNGKINKLIIATNIDFDDALKSSFDQLQDNIPILDLIKKETGQEAESWKFKKETGQEAENWKFTENDFLHRKEIFKQLESTYDSIKLIKELLECVLKKDPVTEESLLGAYFYDLVESGIIDDISGKFHSNFINNDDGLSEKAKKFREFILKIGFKDRIGSLNSNFKLENLEGIAKIISSKINYSKNGKEVKITRQGEQGEIVNDNIDKLANYVLVEDEQNKVRFSRVFWEDEDKELPGNLSQFRGLLKTELNKLKLISQNDGGSQIYKKLKEYHFTITGKNKDTKKEFTTCKESLISKEAFWKDMGRFDKFKIDSSKIEMVRFAKDHESLLREGIISEREKFNDSFKKGEENSLSDKAKRFRDFLLELGFKNKKENSNSDFKLADPKGIAEIISSKVNKDKKEIRITRQREERRKIVDADIDKLANYVLVEDGQNKVRFSRLFWEEDDTKLPDNLKDFRNQLKDNFIGSQLIDKNDTGEQIYEKLRKYHFTITGENKDTKKKFTTCKERLISEKAFFEGLENGNIKNNINEVLPYKDLPEKSLKDIEEEIDSFFERLTFVVNYSQETLDKFIKKKCSWFVGFETDYVAYEFQARMADNLNLEIEEFISTGEEVKSFFEAAQDKLNSLVLIGPTLEYKAKLDAYGIKFEDNFIQKLFTCKNSDKNFFDSDKKVFNLITKQNTLTAIKVYQAIKAIDQYQNQGSYIFMRLSSILLTKDHVLSALDKCSLLIIECDTTGVNQLYFDLYNKIIDKDKRMVLITREEYPLVGQFAADKTDRSYFTMLTGEPGGSQAKLLNSKEVSFQGKSMILKELITPDELKSLSENLISERKEDEAEKILSELMNKSEIKIGSPLSKLDNLNKLLFDKTLDEPIYIGESEEGERLVRNKVKIKKKIKQSNDFHYVSSTIPNSVNDEKDIILIKDINDQNALQAFKNLCGKYQDHNIHLLRKEKDNVNFAWHRSRGSVSNLRPYLDENSKEISYEDPNDERIVVISAEAGMGKSATLEKLSKNEQDNGNWVIVISLKKYGEQLKQLVNEVGKGVEGVVEFLSKIDDGEGLKDTLAKNLLIDYLRKEDIDKSKKVILSIDGFDEINTSEQEKVLKLLKLLKDKTQVEKVLITTKKNMQYKLENNVGTFSYTLKPFSENEQKEFLRKFFEKSIDDIDNNELENNGKFGTFFNALLEKFPEKSRRRFIDIPLHLGMVGKVLRDKFRDFYLSKGDNTDPNEHLQEFNLLSLYQEFTKLKYDIYLDKYLKDEEFDTDKKKGIKDAFVKSIKEAHQNLALKYLFSNSKIEALLKKEESIVFKDEQLPDIGIVDRYDDKFCFVHETFAEYFAADKFAYILESDLSRKKHRENEISGYKFNYLRELLRENLFKENYEDVRRFFDYRLAKNSPIHTAVLDGNEIKVKELLNQRKEKDIGGRIPIHLAAQNGHEGIVNILIEKETNFKDAILGKDNIFKWTSLHYASIIDDFTIGRCSIIGKLTNNKGLQNLDVEIYEDYKGQTPLHFAASMSRKLQPINSLSETIISLLVQKGISSLNDAPVRYVIPRLMRAQKNSNIQDRNGQTPLHLSSINLENGKIISEILLEAKSDIPLVFNFFVIDNKEIVLNQESKADPNTLDKEGKTALNLALEIGNSIEVCDILLNHNGKINLRIEGKILASLLLHIPISIDNTKSFIKSIQGKIQAKEFDILLSKEAFNEDKRSYQLLKEIIKPNISFKKIKDMINRKSKALLESISQAKDTEKKGVLHYSVELNSPIKFIEFLIKNGANSNAIDSEGNVPLYYAIKGNACDDIIDSLKKHLDLNHIDLAKKGEMIAYALNNKKDKVAKFIASSFCSSGGSRRSKRDDDECMFSWQNEDQFAIDSEKFIDYIKELPEEKRDQLIPSADGVKVTGRFQDLIKKLTNNKKVMNHFNRVGRISGMTMHGMMAKNVLADFLNGNYQGVAINVGFIAGGQGFAKVAEAASLKGLKLASEGKLLLGTSLRAASPFLARGTSAFVVYDLVNQVKAFKMVQKKHWLV